MIFEIITAYSLEELKDKLNEAMHIQDEVVYIHINKIVPSSIGEKFEALIRRAVRL